MSIKCCKATGYRPDGAYKEKSNAGINGLFGHERLKAEYRRGKEVWAQSQKGFIALAEEMVSRP